MSKYPFLTNSKLASDFSCSAFVCVCVCMCMHARTIINKACIAEYKIQSGSGHFRIFYLPLLCIQYFLVQAIITTNG